MFLLKDLCSFKVALKIYWSHFLDRDQMQLQKNVQEQ